MSRSRESARPGQREVLVVDDDADLRSALVDWLRGEGIAARAASDGVDALEKLRAGAPPCALLLDLDMPRLGGSGVLAALRADRRLAHVPVVVMTAGGATPGQLAKPFELGSMLGLLVGACRACGACDGAPRPLGSIFAARRRADQRVRQPRQ